MMLHVKNAVAKKLIGFCGERWPRATADFAFKKFSRTARPKRKRYTQGMPDGVEPLMLQTPSGLVATWHLPATERAGKKALLIHGWNSRSLHLLSLARRLNAEGVDVVMLDLPGHGTSGGRHLHLGRGIEAIDAAWRHHGPFHAFVGHSFGGAVALNAALGSSMCIPARRPQSLVMIASPNSMPAFFRWFANRVGLPPAAEEALGRKVFTILGRPLDLLVASEQLKDLHLPVLVVHDMDDTDVLYTDALRMAGAGRHVTLHTTSGLGHRRVLKDRDVHNAVIGHVLGKTDAVPPQPLKLVEPCA